MPQSSIPARPIEGNEDILVDIYDDGGQTVSLGEGKKPLILLPDDTFGRDFDAASEYSRHPGIRPRWGKVLAVTRFAETLGIKVGDKVLMDTMKWSRGVIYDEQGRKLWRIKADDVLAVDEDGFTDEEQAHMESRYQE